MRSVHWFHKTYRHYSDFILLLYNVLEYNTLYIVLLCIGTRCGRLLVVSMVTSINLPLTCYINPYLDLEYTIGIISAYE